MKLSTSSFALTLLLAGSLSASTALKITEIHSAGSGNGTYGADWFELTNYSNSVINLTGWKVDDNSQSPAAAVALRGVTSINPGQSIVFAEGGSTSANDAALAASFISAWFGAQAPLNFTLGFYGGSGVGLSTSTDQVNIYNPAGVTPNTPVASVWFGSSTAGFTFDNFGGLDDVSTQLTTLSSIGTNGAFKSFNNLEVGSPGQIPEPSTYAAILGAAALGFAAYRRRLVSA